jgi:hypothetical protein
MRRCTWLARSALTLVSLAGVDCLPAADALSVKPIPVCEVLANLTAYTGKRLAVMGKFHAGGLTDGCCALVQDRCAQNVITEAKPRGRGITTGFAWQNQIDLVKLEVAPTELIFGGAELDEELRRAGIWTQLNCYKVAMRKPDGTVVTGKKRQQWAVAYGTLKTRKLLRGPRGIPGTLSFEWGNGFGHLGAAPAQLQYSGFKFIGSDLCSDPT